MTIMLNLRKKSCQEQHTLERAMFLISIFHKLCKISVEILKIMLIVLAPSHKKNTKQQHLSQSNVSKYNFNHVSVFVVQLFFEMLAPAWVYRLPFI